MQNTAKRIDETKAKSARRCFQCITKRVTSDRVALHPATIGGAMSHQETASIEATANFRRMRRTAAFLGFTPNLDG
jgi:hypothetical protein